MSAEHRFAIGAGYLVAPLFVGLLGFSVDWWFNRTAAEDEKPGDPPSTDRAAGTEEPTKTNDQADGRLSWRQTLVAYLTIVLAMRKGLADDRHTVSRAVLAVGTIFIGSVAGAFLLSPPILLVFWAQCALLLLIVLFAMLVAYRDPDPKQHRVPERLFVFVGVLITAGAVALGYEQLFAGASFDAADVRLQQGETVRGAYITTTDTAVLLVTRGSRGCPAITALRRDQIEQVRIRPAKLEVSSEEPGTCAGTADWPTARAAGR